MSVTANDTTTPASTPQAAANLAQMSNTIFGPAVSSTWQWQLSGTLNTGYQVDLYSIDLFDNSSSTIRRIKKVAAA